MSVVFLRTAVRLFGLVCDGGAKGDAPESSTAFRQASLDLGHSGLGDVWASETGVRNRSDGEDADEAEELVLEMESMCPATGVDSGVFAKKAL